MISLRSTLFALCCIAAHAPLQAATVAIDGEAPRERITVTIRDTSIGAALRDIGQAYGFEIKGAEIAGGEEAVSTTISGNLEDVLTRLLRNVNHVIVRSPDNRSGIEKVIIMGNRASPSPSVQQAIPDGWRSNAERRSYSAEQGRD